VVPDDRPAGGHGVGDGIPASFDRGRLWAGVRRRGVERRPGQGLRVEGPAVSQGLPMPTLPGSTPGTQVDGERLRLPRNFQSSHGWEDSEYIHVKATGDDALSDARTRELGLWWQRRLKTTRSWIRWH
jgi:hypothetical protein